jgi:hypothetical protein
MYDLGCTVCYALHSRYLEVDISHCYQEMFCTLSFPVDHVSGTDGVSLKFTEDEENDWYSLQPSGV